MQKNLVTVSIVTFNHAHCVRDALDSIFRQTHRDIEVVVVDNASSDGSAAMVAERFPEVLLLANAQNAGYTRAANQGMARASGRWLCWASIRD